MRRPVACPLAWSLHGGSVDGFGRSAHELPTNDCPWISPGSRLWSPGLSRSRLAACVSCSALHDKRGVVSCPFACPVRWCTRRPVVGLHHLFYCSALPAKEGRKGEPEMDARGGGR
jgi:hypothetical protein